ncbi:hypothetical protein ACP70R_047270 [Stipagrostis hirtigluma subsp. patula]
MAYATLVCLLLSCLCSRYCSIALAIAHEDHGFRTVSTRSMESGTECSASTSTVNNPHASGATLPLAHRHGPCAPVRTDGEKPSFAETLRRDRSRARHVVGRARRRLAGSDDGASIPTYLGSSVDSLQYVVTVGLGTPAVEQTVLIDTGSDLSWVQCQPCNATACYPQKHPLFDPSSSSTYAPVPCGAVACRNLTLDFYGNGCTNTSGSSLCSYGIVYGNSATTTGVYSTETLTLKRGVVVKNFGFGCGHSQHGPYDKFDGLMGLGGAPESLVSQTSHTYGGAFSYCLPPVDSAAGFLALGAPANTSGFVFTPMRRLATTFYEVKLAGVSIGGEDLDIAPSVLSGGMIIDSGTIITSLPATAFAALRSAFRKAMAAYPLAPPVGHLDTCYNLTGYANVTVPRVALTFSGGATVDLDVPSGILSGGCLAFVGASEDNVTTVLGNVNQRTVEVLYDVAGGRVGFRAGAC